VNNLKIFVLILAFILLLTSCELPHKKIISFCELINNSETFLGKEITVKGIYERIDGLNNIYFYEPECDDKRVWLLFSQKINFNEKGINTIALNKMIKDAEPIPSPENHSVIIVNMASAKVVFKGYLKKNKKIKYDKSKPWIEQIETSLPKNSYDLIFVVTEIKDIQYNPVKNN